MPALDVFSRSHTHTHSHTGVKFICVCARFVEMRLHLSNVHDSLIRCRTLFASLVVSFQCKQRKFSYHYVCTISHTHAQQILISFLFRFLFFFLHKFIVYRQMSLTSRPIKRNVFQTKTYSQTVDTHHFSHSTTTNRHRRRIYSVSFFLTCERKWMSDCM